jgi:hypothetical protein
MRSSAIAGAILLVALVALPCHAQNSSKPPIREDTGGVTATLFGGGGVLNSETQTGGALQFGAAFGVSPPNTFFGFDLETGYVAAVAKGSQRSAVFSANYRPSWVLSRLRCTFASPCPVVFATAGYSRLFETGNALDFGGGMDYYFAKNARALRIEARDYMTWQAPKQRNVALRIGLVFVLAD